ncbi:fimbrillin family protein [Parabacteroides merdae]|uniref:fimbrillin family protein n=1 Tax=Parabacteroides merdae TaxID=46503 RepID=UPI001F1800BB|nr:fimbrillin family protein [Parabacteroides merdae]MCE8886429.1 fimbrillin family protein [Parabacteroides merdae]
MNKLLLFMITAVSIFSCTNDYDPGIIENLGMKEQPLRIITKVLTTKSPNFMQEFTRGSVIGLHVVSESTGNIYDSNPDYKNVRAEAFLVNYKLNWRQSPDIYLNEEPVTVYAYYPYQSQVNFDPENIPVRISPDASLTKDYMYGIQASGQRAVNQISPVALLNMNHTLSLLSFQLRITPEAEGCFLLHAIQIGNKAGGTALCFKGKMNIKTGNIGGCAGTNASTRLKLNTPRMLKKIPDEPQQLMVIPTSRIRTDGDVEVLFTINETTFKYKIPANTKWEKGKRYIYNLLFNGKDITLENVSTSEWLPVEGNMKNTIL